MQVNKKKYTAENTIRSLWIYWFIGLSLIGLYICIVDFLAEQEPAFTIEPSFLYVKYTLYASSFVCLGFAHFFRSSLANKSSRLFKDIAQRIPPTHPFPWLLHCKRAALTSFAFLQMVGINGLVLFIRGRDFEAFYVLIVVSVVALLYFRPRQKEIDNCRNQYLATNQVFAVTH